MLVRPTWLAMWVLLFTLAVAPLIPGKGLDPLTNSWIGVSISVLAATVCWMAIPTAGARRREIALLAAGVTAYAAGDAMYTLLTGNNVEGPFPSVADVGYLLFYPLILGSLIVAAGANFTAWTPRCGWTAHSSRWLPPAG